MKHVKRRLMLASVAVISGPVATFAACNPIMNSDTGSYVRVGTVLSSTLSLDSISATLVQDCKNSNPLLAGDTSCVTDLTQTAISPSVTCADYGISGGCLNYSATCGKTLTNPVMVIMSRPDAAAVASSPARQKAICQEKGWSDVDHYVGTFPVSTYQVKVVIQCK
jgi:hypothetical protein